MSAAGSVTATTNARGEFSLTVPAGTTVTVRVTKADYSLNEVVTNLAPGSVQTVSIGLLRVGAEQTLPVSTGGTVADGAYTFSMPPDFVNAQGNVTVSVTGLDPTTGEVRALPGGLEAVDAQGNIRYLQPVSFAEYTVRDANGTVLQVSPSVSQGANIELPVPVALRGAPGYNIGDPIECYLFDPKDGKWKTPVPGVIGPSSVDGQPVIKATIFHLSWYGGAPARQQQACVWGYVKDKNGKPVKGAHVEVFVGGSATTDADGRYQAAAAPNSFVRIVASIVQNDSVLSGEATVETGDGGGGCTGVHDIVLGRKQQVKYFVSAYYHPHASGALEGEIGVAYAWVSAIGPDGAFPYSEATVKLGDVELPLVSDGYYYSDHNPGGVLYPHDLEPELTIDTDRDGISDAIGYEYAPGDIEIMYPLDDDRTVPPTFIASWRDSRGGEGFNPDYKVRYAMDMSGDSLNSFTTILDGWSLLVGDGSVLRSVFWNDFINHPLAAGEYSMTILPFDGPPELFILDDSILPNLRSGSVGPEVSGFYYVFGEASSTSFEIVGGGKSVKIDNLKPRRGLTPDLLAKQFKEIHQARVRNALR